LKIIVTGINGTVAPVLGRELATRSHSVIAWDRSAVPPDDGAACEQFIDALQPEALCHLATGSAAWAEMLARECAAAGIRFLFTGSVSVFSIAQHGPFTVDVEPQPTDDYGRYKLECEQRILAVNAQAVVARIGWQIADRAGSNNMVDYLTRTNAAAGAIDASENWQPACSFLPDSAAALTELLFDRNACGIYHVDGNPGLSFFEIATRLNERHGRAWKVRRVAEPNWNQRMIDARVRVTPISERL
jgi:dTDP-4-dehydrorhamnose reductase